MEGEMSLFKCPKCGCVENTACGHYWPAVLRKEAPECSECNTGTWHGLFPKQTPEEAGYIISPDGYLHRATEPAPHAGAFPGMPVRPRHQAPTPKAIEAKRAARKARRAKART
jgi:hypothetical protein